VHRFDAVSLPGRARQSSFLILEDSVMTHWWLAPRRRGAQRARALRAPLRLELLEQRNLLSGLVFVPSPQITAQLVGAAAISASDIWAVGIQPANGSQSPLAEHFDGTSWSVVSTPSPTSDSVFKGVAAAARNDVWAVGSGGTNNATLIEHWNGSNWSEVPSPTLPTGSVLKAVTAPASNNAWAVGINSRSNDALVEHWDGMSWSVVSSPAFTGVTILSLGGNISADSTTDVWVVGAQANTAVGAPFNGGVSLHWDGQTWSVMSGPTFAESVTALSPTNVWGAGFRGVQVNYRTVHVPVVEHWDGTSWSIIPSPNPNKNTPQQSASLSGIAAVSANDIWAVGSNGTATLTEHWDGSRWRVINSPNPGQSNFLSAVTALSDGTVTAVGGQFNSTTGETPLILQNAQSTWGPRSVVGRQPGGPSAVVAASPMPAAAPGTRHRTTTAAQPTTMPLLLEPAAVDQLFTAAAGADQPWPVAGHGRRAHQAAVDGELEAFPEDIWSSAGN
jgi:hypothetical protein